MCIYLNGIIANCTRDQSNTIHVNHFILAAMNMNIKGWDIL